MKPKTNITTQLGMQGMHSAMFPMPVAPGDIDLELKFSQLQIRHRNWDWGFINWKLVWSMWSADPSLQSRSTTTTTITTITTTFFLVVAIIVIHNIPVFFTLNGKSSDIGWVYELILLDMCITCCSFCPSYTSLLVSNGHPDVEWLPSPRSSWGSASGNLPGKWENRMILKKLCRNFNLSNSIQGFWWKKKDFPCTSGPLLSEKQRFWQDRSFSGQKDTAGQSDFITLHTIE